MCVAWQSILKMAGRQDIRVRKLLLALPISAQSWQHVVSAEKLRQLLKHKEVLHQVLLTPYTSVSYARP